jgi:flagellar basal-body rod modification protein FlgD
MSSLTVPVSSINTANPSSTAGVTVTASVGADGKSIDPTTSTTTGASSSSSTTAAGNGQMNDQDFLNLFVAELKNQDPTSPMDESAMMTQMAQMQSLESSTNMEKAIDDLSSSYKSSLTAQQNVVTSMTNATAVSLIGKEVRVKQEDVTYSGLADENDQIRINLGNNDAADVQILDDKGAVVKTLHTGEKDGQNSATVDWDGSTDAGGYADAGTYKINVVGSDTDSSLYAFVDNVVQGVGFSSAGASLQVDGKEMSVSDVMNVSPTDDTASSMATISPSTAIGLIGKTVRVQDDSITYGAKNGESRQIKVNANALEPVTISILDDQGNVVDTMNGSADDNGTASFSWSGQTTSGGYAPAGTYTVRIEGQDTNPSLYAFDEGTVDGVSTLNGATQITVDGQIVPVSSIIDITAPSAG